MPKPPFKAKLEDEIFCPQLKRNVPVDAYCHGWAFKDEFCHDAETCEPYLEYAEHRLIELQANRRKIRIPLEIYTKLKERARAKGLSVDEFAAEVILENVKEVKTRA